MKPIEAARNFLPVFLAACAAARIEPPDATVADVLGSTGARILLSENAEVVFFPASRAEDVIAYISVRTALDLRSDDPRPWALPESVEDQFKPNEPKDVARLAVVAVSALAVSRLPRLSDLAAHVGTEGIS